MGKHLLSNSDLILFIVLVATGFWIIRCPIRGFDPGASAALAGALFGGAAILLGNWITRHNESVAGEADLAQRKLKLKTLLAAEAVSVAASLIDAKRFVDASLASLQAGGKTGTQQDMTWLMPPRPWNERMDLELLILERPAIDALLTLRSNLFKTGRSMEAITDGREHFGFLRVSALSNFLAHDMTVLIKVFEHIAPNRKFVINDEPPELVTAILKRLSTNSVEATY